MAKRRILKKKKEVDNAIETIGHLAFFAGIVLTIIVGTIVGILEIRLGEDFTFTGTLPKVILGTLVVLGFLVGLINITTREEVPFLVAASALMLTGVRIGYIIPVPYIGAILDNIVIHIVVFVIPAAIVVALKAVWMLGKDR